MNWKIAEQIGYMPRTTFWEDFTIAEKFGKTAIKETATKVFNEWKNDIEYLTEFIMVLNHKSWANQYNSKLCELYSDLYYEYDNKAINYIEKNMPKEAMNYYFKTLD